MVSSDSFQNILKRPDLYRPMMWNCNMVLAAQLGR